VIPTLLWERSSFFVSWDIMFDCFWGKTWWSKRVRRCFRVHSGGEGGDRSPPSDPKPAGAAWVNTAAAAYTTGHHTRSNQQVHTHMHHASFKAAPRNIPFLLTVRPLWRRAVVFLIPFRKVNFSAAGSDGLLRAVLVLVVPPVSPAVRPVALK